MHLNFRKVITNGELKNNNLQIAKYFLGIAAGLKYIHSKKIIHHSLKPENVFLKNDTVKIGDFGLSISRQSLSIKFRGTELYTAPEVGKRPVKAGLICIHLESFYLNCVMK